MPEPIHVDNATRAGIAEAIAQLEPLAELVDQAAELARVHLGAWELAVERDWHDDYELIPPVGCAVDAARLHDLLDHVAGATLTGAAGWYGDEWELQRRRQRRHLRAVDSDTHPPTGTRR